MLPPAKTNRKSASQRLRHLARREDAGFTFVEVIVVTVLLAVLSLILFGSLDGIIRGREGLQDRSNSTNVARTVLERMSRELSNRALEPLSQNQNSGDGSTGNSTGSSLSNFGRRAFLEGSGGNGGKDKLRFISSGTAQAAYGAFTNYGLVEIEYRLEKDPKGEDSEIFLLLREEKPVAITDQELANSKRVVFPLADNITALNFRFLENGAWKNSWNGVALPEAVEITLKVKGDNGLELPFRTAVAINQRRRGVTR